ncbi:sigma-54-dependent Fis family transcriptional regulator [Desulfobotulus mexicanus]|uniref:AAA domain-containing protein n=1 Tax=Desulfobotulus mexicanus TaxID=2586642 RepID=A0A5Q4VH82_9BACT|nr:sigma 54-interacting transcriptional regulator [Desulfobotulus mexicanus]TYT75717.1 AAA domain-containing protein [Desulfobotulus mexicanus]
MMTFERLLFEISSKFVNIPASEVDQEINDAIRKIVEFLGIDQSVFGEFRDGSHELKISHGYTAHIWPENPGIILNALAPNITLRLKRGEVVNLSSLPDDAPEDWHEERQYAEKVGLKSCVGVSLKIGGSVLGVIIFESYRRHQNWTETSIRHMRLLAQVFASALERKQTELKLRKAFDTIQKLSERLKAENSYLKESILSENRYSHIIGNSPAMTEVLNRMEQVSVTDASVLLMGETGTGKTVLAELVHAISHRSTKTMIKVNCAALPSNLLESEFFGHEKGAFTGAVNKKIGRFAIAHGSTLFLDEIGELPLDLQAKFLRVLDDGEFEPIGSNRTVRVNVRIVAATNRNLARMVQEGTFRSDLYYRLNVYPILVPPLRERQEDIPEMVHSFIHQLSKSMGRHIGPLSEKDMAAMTAYSWPGNIRELKNVVENAMISSQGAVLSLHPPPGGHEHQPQETLNHAEAERQLILSTLQQARGRIKGAGGAAAILELKPSTLYSKMKKLGIRNPWKSPEP